jgi:hypothetical protein
LNYRNFTKNEVKKCFCYDCLQNKVDLSKLIDRGKSEKGEQGKADCSNCYQYKTVNSETGLCKVCAN